MIHKRSDQTQFMLAVSDLPDLTFVTLDADRHLSLAESGGRIAALVDQITTKFPAKSRLGLIYRSSPELILGWLAAVAAGMTPIILSYPTAKLARHYWATETHNSIASLELTGLLVAPEIDIAPAIQSSVTVVTLDFEREADWAVETLGDASVMQQSSGTTGARKGIVFALSTMVRHIDLYDRTVKVTQDDCIVSWLPLYHDMGFVACFLMALVRGVRLVLIDAMDWIRTPDLLYRAIERHRGTLCYMPNFAFRVMTRAKPQDLSSMRLWVACAEPVVAETIEAFLQHTGTPSDHFAACYAMAENVFAISQSEGLRTAMVDGRRLVSCGRPIDGIEIELRDDEVWVHSPTALDCYADGVSIRDARGFYPTGDLARIIDGEIHVWGRKNDVLIQAGVKYLLSDLDHALGDAVPDLNGRGACVAWDDPELGTQVPLFLVERRDFFLEPVSDRLRGILSNATGLAHFLIEFVPSGFLTKTSSGKINRKRSLADWRAVVDARAQPLSGRGGDLAQEIATQLGACPMDRPVGEVFDSLSLTILATLLEDYRLQWSVDENLETILARHEKATVIEPVRDDGQVISIVSIADSRQVTWMGDQFRDGLAELLGCPVHFEHICLPPAPILLSDLIFHDYFLPRQASEDYVAVRSQLAKLKNASVVIMNDVAELDFGNHQIYPALAHDFVRDTAADLLTFRWQRYAAYHDRLPVKPVSGPALPLEQRNLSIAALETYLGVPIFKFALLTGYQPVTQVWDYCEYNSAIRQPEPNQPTTKSIQLAFIDFLGALTQPLKRYSAAQSPYRDINDLPHFCSSLIRSEVVDDLLARYDDFYLIGPHSSLPYLRRRAAELGKHVIAQPSFPTVTQAEAEQWECALVVGAWGDTATSKPVIALMTMGETYNSKNAPADFTARYDTFEALPVYTGGFYDPFGF